MMLRFALLFAFTAAPALAQDAAAGAAPSPLAGLMPLVVIVAIFYFLIIRPQNKKMKDHRALIASVERNDKVVTAGGIHGKVTKVADDGTVMVEVASGVELKVEQSTLSNVMNKNGEAKNSAAASEKGSSASNDNKAA